MGDTIECQHASCNDPSDTGVITESGEQYDLCEDHAHMEVDGTPVDGYEPNDPSKFK